MMEEAFYYWCMYYLLYTVWNYFRAEKRLREKKIKIGGKDALDLTNDDMTSMSNVTEMLEKGQEMLKEKSTAFEKFNSFMGYTADVFFPIYALLYMSWAVKISVLLIPFLVCYTLWAAANQSQGMRTMWKAWKITDAAKVIIMLNLLLMHYL